MRMYISNIITCKSNKDRCGRLAGRRVYPASVSFGSGSALMICLIDVFEQHGRCVIVSTKIWSDRGGVCGLQEYRERCDKFQCCFDLEPELQNCGTLVLVAPA